MFKPVCRLSIAALLIGSSSAAIAEGAGGAPMDLNGFYAGLGIESTSIYSDTEGQLEHVDGVRQWTRDGAGVSGVVTLGHRGQLGSVILGLEGQLLLGDPLAMAGGDQYLTSSLQLCGGPPEQCVNSGLIGFLDPVWRVRGTMGKELAPGVSVFGSAGFAAADVTVNGNFVTYMYRDSVGGGEGYSQRLFDDPVTERVTGPSLGAGIEMKVSQRLSLRGEASIDYFGHVDASGGEGRPYWDAGNDHLLEVEMPASENTALINKSMQVSVIWSVVD